MDVFAKKKRSEIMSKIRSESGIETMPEKLKGLYLRKHPKGVMGNPDFGNKSKKVALFLDGCFWHGCPRHYRNPKSNRGYRGDKIRKNKKRDRFVSRMLEKGGWTVIRIWECEILQQTDKLWI